MKKTNALRILDRSGVPYRIAEYDAPDGAIDAVAVAERIGMPPEQVFKTLIGTGGGADYVVFVIPGPCELDLRRAAKASGRKRIDLIPVKELFGATGYVRGGCSPVGMKKPFPTFIDESCELFEEIAVSAGVIGMQMIVAPDDLMRVSGAQAADLV